ncbi:MAG TPA: hypothetical protein VFC51_10605 [Chloroflexota bacterium]|nr:hypothetical protein [Chloroflexota bacterium]
MRTSTRIAAMVSVILATFGTALTPADAAVQDDMAACVSDQMMSGQGTMASEAAMAMMGDEPGGASAMQASGGEMMASDAMTMGDNASSAGSTASDSMMMTSPATSDGASTANAMGSDMGQGTMAGCGDSTPAGT